MADKKVGRKSLYDTRIVPNLDYIRDAVAAGVEEKTIRDALEISETAWNDHKRHHEEFTAIFTCARARATIDKLILASKALDKLAAGYDYEEKKQYQRKNKKGVDVGGLEIYTKHQPPNPTAIAMILRNLDKEFSDRDFMTMEMKRSEAELKKKLAEMQMIDFEGV